MQRLVTGAIAILIAMAFLTNPQREQFRNYYETTLLSQSKAGSAVEAAVMKGVNTFFGTVTTNLAMNATTRKDFLLFSLYTLRHDNGQESRWVGVFNRFIPLEER